MVEAVPEVARPRLEGLAKSEGVRHRETGEQVGPGSKDGRGSGEPQRLRPVYIETGRQENKGAGITGTMGKSRGGRVVKETIVSGCEWGLGGKGYRDTCK